MTPLLDIVRAHSINSPPDPLPLRKGNAYAYISHAVKRLGTLSNDSPTKTSAGTICFFWGCRRHLEASQPRLPQDTLHQLYSPTPVIPTKLIPPLSASDSIFHPFSLTRFNP
jgi:hypothetical protein